MQAEKKNLCLINMVKESRASATKKNFWCKCSFLKNMQDGFLNPKMIKKMLQRINVCGFFYLKKIIIAKDV